MTLIIALLKINSTLLLCYLLYRFLLRRLTFYNLNRVFLLGALVLSSAMPFIRIRLEAPAARPAALIEAARSYTLPAITPAAFDYTDMVQPVFWAGVALMGLRLVIQLFSVLRLYARARTTRLGDAPLHILPGQGNAFSFFRNIFIYHSTLSDPELPMIITHEKVHARQWHSIDILACELHKVLCWFNPAAWLMMQAIRENLEFIADRAVLKTGTTAKTYQYSLLRVSQGHSAIPVLANNFNFSSLKTRIMMMNKKQSSPVHVMRYFAAAPLALALVCCFGVSMGQQKKQTITKTPRPEAVVTQDPQVMVVPMADSKKQPGGKVKSVRIVRDDNAVASNATPQRTAVVEMESGETRKVQLDQPGTMTAQNAKARPLVMLDGKKIDYSEIESVNPKNIKSVTVLKDADALLQYGDEAKEGVILIVTKDKK